MKTRQRQHEPVIGLEVHVELNTESKMFCSNSTQYFGQTPNIHTCPVCLGFPGALPYTNKKAIEYCIKIGLALGCEIAEETVFERKNYFYSDLPKGYQISQYRWPLCRGGRMVVKNKVGEEREIRVNRVHMEEDTAKLVHQFGISNSKGATLIDFNRSGVPLVEIVTEPDFRDLAEIRDYAKKLQQVMRYLGVSNADMEKGDMRLEANVSVRQVQSSKFKVQNELPKYRIELKNINSFRFMVAAVQYEIERQIEALEKGEKLVQETRGWDENNRRTYVQRVKEEATDYRYFPEPDIPPIEIDKDIETELRRQMPELPWEKTERLIQEYSLSSSQARVLSETQEFADYFEEAVKVVNSLSLSLSLSLSPVRIANVLINKKFDREQVLPARFVEMIREEEDRPGVSSEELEGAVHSVIAENTKAVADYRKGKEASLQFLLGQVMAKTRGQSNPVAIREALLRNLR
ncbi:MAG: Asp-tRNA(Asn)/Glu-tRNA(Gln) amidotransferase subunit GatB [Candidatus Blackburnbacteria bacterium]|nr:Asp-tRNA(Asn)/Glu-tRNA(Gln) amidotransferase subunit GatB [Candidatus Blackburnbacteria bacterium]